MSSPGAEGSGEQQTSQAPRRQGTRSSGEPAKGRARAAAAADAAQPDEEQRALELTREQLAREIVELTPLLRRRPPLQSLASPERRLAEAEADQAEQANDLRLVYGLGLLLVMLIQIAGADYIFYRYASSASVHWDVPGSTMNVWLSATVVQVIAIVGIVVHYLFPNQEVRGRRTRRSSAQPQ